MNGYMELAAAVIRQAIADLKWIESKDNKKAKIGRDAYRFLKGEGLEAWCNVLGLSANYIRKELGKTCDLFKEYAGTPKSQE